jgi:tetratricopeptide (TPR) repeat protein
VIGLLKNNLQQANRYYDKGEYEKALKYFKLVSQNKLDNDSHLKIARSFYFIKKYQEAAGVYARLQSKNPLSGEDLVFYAEINTSVGNYTSAIESYNGILKTRPGDPVILQRLWQLSNLHLLYEDSLHYTVGRLSVNSTSAELSAVPFKRGIVFLSDRKEIDFKNPGHENTESEFNLFYAEIAGDTIVPGLRSKFKPPVNFGKVFHMASGLGPACFYAENSKCIFAAVGNELSGGKNNMQLFFSENKNGKWSAPQSFEHNNKAYNLKDPAMSEDGKILYFASDKPGGFGDSDIYRCVWKDGQWSSPENMGERINTGKHEAFPFLYYNTLYFSSDGHPGLGGLDIFSTIVSAGNNPDVKNLGYPLNSGSDDFGFILLSGSRGYFTSNRLNGGFDDDLYEFEMDFRAYPFDIAGMIKVQDKNATDSLRYGVMSNAKIELVDYSRNEVIAHTATDVNGKFSVSIPYFSKYALRLFDQDNVEHIVSLEINRESSKNSDYEIVVIKQSANGSPKANIQRE